MLSAPQVDADEIRSLDGDGKRTELDGEDWRLSPAPSVHRGDEQPAAV